MQNTKHYFCLLLLVPLLRIVIQGPRSKILSGGGGGLKRECVMVSQLGVGRSGGILNWEILSDTGRWI